MECKSRLPRQSSALNHPPPPLLLTLLSCISVPCSTQSQKSRNGSECLKTILRTSLDTTKHSNIPVRLLSTTRGGSCSPSTNMIKEVQSNFMASDTCFQIKILHHKYYVEFHCPDIQKAIRANRLFQVRTISNFKDLQNHFEFPFICHSEINLH